MAYCKGCKFLKKDDRYHEVIYVCHHPENLRGELYPRNEIGKRYYNKNAIPRIHDVNPDGKCDKWKAGLLAMFGLIDKEEPDVTGRVV